MAAPPPHLAVESHPLCHYIQVLGVMWQRYRYWLPVDNFTTAYLPALFIIPFIDSEAPHLVLQGRTL